MEPDSVDMNRVRDMIVDGLFNGHWEICDVTLWDNCGTILIF
jgi:hypothetical protein